MKKLHALRTGAAAAVLSLASTALAAGDSGTSSVGEMQVTGAQFGMMVGGLVGMGAVVWIIAKFVGK